MRKPVSNKPLKEQDALVKERDEFKKFLSERIQMGSEYLTRTIGTHGELETYKRDSSNWNAVNSEYLKHAFNNEYNEYKREYDTYGQFDGVYEHAMGVRRNQVEELKHDIQNKIEALERLLLKADLLKSNIEGEKTDTSLSSANQVNVALNKDIFIVHGHNHEVQQSVARVIERLELNPVILGDQPNSGNTVIEKFEKYSNVGYAIVLLTDDDLGKAKSESDLHKRARQNVILELGYFFCKLGRGRVLPLYVEGVELPSDINGLVYTLIDSAGRWQFEVVRELKAIGYEVDANKLL